MNMSGADLVFRRPLEKSYLGCWPREKGKSELRSPAFHLVDRLSPRIFLETYFKDSISIFVAIKVGRGAGPAGSLLLHLGLSSNR